MRALLYYGHTVNSIILPSLSFLATQQIKPTQKMMAKVKQLSDYCASQKDAIITYNMTKMILNMHSNAGYLNKKMHGTELVDIFSVRQQ